MFENKIHPGYRKTKIVWERVNNFPEDDIPQDLDVVNKLFVYK